MRVAVVTGAAGAIGGAAMRRLADGGDRAVGLDLVEADDVYACDVTDPELVGEAFARIESDAGSPQVLVNCAGLTGEGGVEDEPPSTWDRILAVNLSAAYLCARQAIPAMRRAGGGKIVNVSSVNARFGGSALSGPAYAAAKGGLLTLTRFLAREHAEDNIQVNAVAPGPHDTPMWDALDPSLRTEILATIPAGIGPGDPDDLADLIHFLCSPAAGYITGATIDVNGGQWMG